MEGVKADIAKTYGSISRLATKLGINRSTLGRVLDGSYTGDIDKYRKAIDKQLEADGYDGIFSTEMTADTDARKHALMRLTLTTNFVKLLKHRRIDDEEIKASLDLVTDELTEIQGVLSATQ